LQFTGLPKIISLTHKTNSFQSGTGNVEYALTPTIPPQSLGRNMAESPIIYPQSVGRLSNYKNVDSPRCPPHSLQ